MLATKNLYIYYKFVSLTLPCKASAHNPSLKNMNLKGSNC
jgi:hypothetical protein